MKNQTTINTKIIRAINEKLKSVSIVEVAKKLKRSHQSLYFHLDESRADKANLDMLKKISIAVKALEAEAKKESEQTLQLLNN